MIPPQGLASSPSFAFPARGDLIAGRYRIERKIGTGGMGLVVAALDEQMGHRVAIKLLLPEGPAPSAAFLRVDDSRVVARSDKHKELSTRLVREASAASRLQSAHVTRVLDVGRLDSGDPYIVMELLEGSDLGRYARERGPLPIVEAVNLVLQACEAIVEAHALGIIHRDLKPGNLFLTHKLDGTPFLKVLDFGISKVLGADDNQLTGTSDMLGSPLFMAPEQIRNARDVDERADVWSLGTILYKLLGGRAAFEAQGSAATLAAIISDAPEPLRNARPDVPPDLEAIVLRCLEKDRSRRIQSARELAIALQRFAVVQTGASLPAVAAPPPGAFAPVTSVAPNAVTVSGSRGRPLALAAVGLLCAAVIGGSLVAWRLLASGPVAGEANGGVANGAVNGGAVNGGAVNGGVVKGTQGSTDAPRIADAPPPSVAASGPVVSATASAAPSPAEVVSAMATSPAAPGASPAEVVSAVATSPAAPGASPAPVTSAAATAAASARARPPPRPVHGKPSDDPLGDRL